MTESINNDRNPPSTPMPGELIRQAMKDRNWTQADLANILNRPLPTVNEIIQGKRAIMPEMARALAEAFGTTAEVWMQREAMYRLSLTEGDFRPIRRRARLFDLAPVKELQKRGWIGSGDDEGIVEADLLKLLEIGSLDDDPRLGVAMRRSDPLTQLTPAQRAWCFRVRQVARSMRVTEFVPNNISQCEQELRKVAAYSQEARKVPAILASCGIRFVIVEPLSGGKIDGMTTWLDDSSPVIGMSIRYDRIDNFWHTLCHEFSHVRHGDALSVDAFDEMIERGALPLEVKPVMERRADNEAAAMLIPPAEMESFVRRFSPLYSKEKINQFANRIKIHPGVIVGQLQNRKEIGYAANREMLVKVRQTVVSTAFTDGWGQSIESRVDL